ncbi:MAG: DUF262 domain-containing protein [Chroococcales cyanobacterium]
MLVTPTEQKMWKNSASQNFRSRSYREVEIKYASGQHRIVTEINRENLPSFVASLKTQAYRKSQPVYQRRQRWNAVQQSRLIESFLINIPVPPIILYEVSYKSYEVIDGQQRISAIRNFYEGKLILEGFEIWPELNGLNYHDLPRKIREGIDRGSISSIVMITESAPDNEQALFLKQKTFERFNTGRVPLSNQEVRNCLYPGPFNGLLLDLSAHERFKQAWGIPLDNDPENLTQNILYDKMEDVELVLRFFALRHVDQFRNGMKDFLDLYMIKSLQFITEDITVLKRLFLEVLNLGFEIYGKFLFKPFDIQKNEWENRPNQAYYDAVMVGLSRHLENAQILTERKAFVIEATQALFNRPEAGLLTGKGTSKADIQKRISLFDEMLAQVIAG